MVREINTKVTDGTPKEIVKVSLELLTELTGVLGLLEKKEETLEEQVEELIKQRQEARKNKNYALSDEIRDKLKDMGIVLEDTPSGVKWRKI